MNLNSLPLELLARIFVNLGEINPGQLSLASRKWQAVTKGIHESYIGNSMNLIYDDLGKPPSKHCLDKQNRAFYLLRKYDLLKKQFLKGDNNHWIQLVNDPVFDFEVIKIISNHIVNEVLMEVVAEFATCRGEVEIIKWLIRDAPIKKDPNGQIIKGMGLKSKSISLIQSCLVGLQEIAKVLLESGADVHYDNSQALCMSSKYGHIACVKLLVEYGADIHVDEEYPLVHSCRQGHFEVAAYLISQGAMIHARRDCALHWASEGGHSRIVSLLIDNGADIHSNEDHALRWSAVHGHNRIVEILLHQGADVHAMDNYALRNAVKMRHLNIITTLLKWGADKTANNDECMKWAAEHGDGEVLEILLKSYSREETMKHSTTFF